MPHPSLTPLIEPRRVLIITQTPERLPPGSASASAHIRCLTPEALGQTEAPTTTRDPDGRPDLAWIDVAADALPATLQHLAAWQPRAVVISQLEPTTAAGASRAWAQRHGCLLLGPNSFGLQRPSLGLNLSLHPQLAPAGRVAVITQSRAIMAAIMDWVDDTRTALSAVVSLGADSTVSVGDLLDYFAFDRHTDSIALYLDDPGPARPFLSALRGAARVKPVVVLKAGRRLPAATPDGLLPDPVFDAALRRAGALRVRFFLQLFSTLKALNQRHRPRGARLALLANGHGPVDLVQDGLAMQHAIRCATLGSATRQALQAVLSAHATIDNPVIEVAPWPLPAFRRAIDILLDDPGVDALLLMLSPEPHNDLPGMVEILIDLVPQRRKPLVVCLMGDATMRRLRGRLAEAGIPAFRTPETAADAFGQLVRFHANQQLLLQTQSASPLLPEVDDGVWLPELRQHLNEQRAEVPTALTRQILAAHGLPVQDAPPVTGAIVAASAQVVRDPQFGAVMVLQPAGPTLPLRSDNLELLPLNRFLVRRLIERSSLWRQGLSREVATPALEQFEQQLLMLAELAVARPELGTLALDPILVTDRASVILNARLQTVARDTPPLPGASFAPHLAIAPYPVHWHRHCHFADGTPWTLRPIRPEDAEALQRFVRGLSTETRYMRFISTLRELPPHLLARYTQIDYDREVALIATVSQANPAHRNFPHETLIGLAHFLRNADDNGAEYALVIADAWQRRGLGPALMRALVAAAREQSLDHLEGQVLATNKAMLGLMQRLGFTNEADPDEPTLRRVWQRLPSPASRHDAVQRNEG